MMKMLLPIGIPLAYARGSDQSRNRRLAIFEEGSMLGSRSEIMYRSCIVFACAGVLFAGWCWGQSKPAAGNPERPVSRQELMEWKQTLSATVQRQIADGIQAEIRTLKPQMAADLRQQIKIELRQEIAAELRQQLKSDLKQELGQKLKSELKMELLQEWRRP